MTSRELLEAIGGIDDKFIEEAAPVIREKEKFTAEKDADFETKIAGKIDSGKEKESSKVIYMTGRKKKFSQNGAAIAAACAVLVLVGGIYGKIRMDQSAVPELAAASYSIEGDSAVEEQALGSGFGESAEEGAPEMYAMKQFEADGSEDVQATAGDADDFRVSAESIQENAEDSMNSKMVTGAMIGNPWVDCADIEEAEEMAGFKISVPESYGEFTEKEISVLSDETSSEGNMIQVIYRDAAGEEGMRIRKAAMYGTEETDISGDYNAYSYDETEEILGYSVRARGDENRIFLLTWNGDGFDYAVSFEGGIPMDNRSEMEEIMDEIMN